MDLYPRCRVTGMRWILVEATERVMPEIGPKLAEFAVRELRGRGIEIRTKTTLEELTADRARLSDGEVVPTRTLVWTAGVKPSPAVAKLGLALDEQGRFLSGVTGEAAVSDPAGRTTTVPLTGA